MKQTGRNVRHSLSDSIRENPIPAALVGLGIGWLAVNAFRNRGDDDDRYFVHRQTPPEGVGRPYAAYRPRGQEIEDSGIGRTGFSAVAASAKAKMSHDADDAGDRARHAGSSVREGLEHARERASSTMHSVRDRASSTMHSMQDRASESFHQARDAAEHAVDRMQSGAVRAKESFWDTFEEHPLSIGLTMMAVGVAAGLAIPSSRKEDELLGSRRDELFREAKSYGREMMRKGREVAEAAVDAATEEAQEENLTASGASSDAKQSMREMKDTAKQAGRDIADTAKETGQDLKNRAKNVADAARDAANEEAERQHLKQGT